MEIKTRQQQWSPGLGRLGQASGRGRWLSLTSDIRHCSTLVQLHTGPHWCKLAHPGEHWCTLDTACSVQHSCQCTVEVLCSCPGVTSLDIRPTMQCNRIQLNTVLVVNTEYSGIVVNILKWYCVQCNAIEFTWMQTKVVKLSPVQLQKVASPPWYRRHCNALYWKVLGQCCWYIELISMLKHSAADYALCTMQCTIHSAICVALQLIWEGVFMPCNVQCNMWCIKQCDMHCIMCIIWSAIYTVQYISSAICGVAVDMRRRRAPVTADHLPVGKLQRTDGIYLIMVLILNFCRN